MDIRQLRYFIAAAEEGHLGRAAERLHLSQPALTRQIQLMEETIGAELFLRTPRGVVLTQTGQALLEDARSVDQRMDQTLERARRMGRGELGTLDVGAFGTAQFEYVPRLLAHLGRSHPEVGVTLSYEPIDQLIAALRQRRVLVVFERRVIDEPDITTTVVLREPTVLAVNERHPLAQQPQVDIDDLRNEPLIVGRDRTRQLGTLEFCRGHGFEPRVVAYTFDMTTSVVLVASGIGSAIVPRCLTNVHLPGVVYKSLTGRFDLSFDLFCYHLKTEQSPLLAVALEAVNTLAAQTQTQTQTEVEMEVESNKAKPPPRPRKWP